MSFTSPIFLFAFLPLVLLAERALPGTQRKNWLLALAGLLFFSFGRLEYVLVLVGSAAVNYGLALLLRRSPRKSIAAVGVLVNLGILAACRRMALYSGHMSGLLSVAVFTMKGLSYLLDVYRGDIKSTERFFAVLFYMSFFPLVQAGPLLPYWEFEDWMLSRNVSAETTAAGVQRLIAGLGKKLLLGDTLGIAAAQVYGMYLAPDMDFRLAWVGCVCGALQLYFVLSGYSDISIGICKILGLDLSENYNYPYGALSLRDFWQRWNISLTAWMEDYLCRHIANQGQLKRGLIGLCIFLCLGLWHGVGVSFALWGLLNGILVLLEMGNIIPVQRLSATAAGRVMCRVYMLLSVLVLSVLVQAGSLGNAWTMLTAMFGFAVSEQGLYGLYTVMNGATTVVLVLSAVLSVGFARGLSNRMEKTPMWVQDTYMIGKRLGSIAVLLLCMMCLAQSSGVSVGYFGF